MSASISSPAELPRKLGLIDSLSIVIGVVIGAGIFLVPNLVARELKSTPGIISVWIFGGVISFLGALACAELGSALPSTGGQYVYLRQAYGPMIGFLCGWSMFVVTRSAQVAWLAVTMMLYVSYFHPLSAIAAKLLGIAVIAIFMAVNYRGVVLGALVQKIFTFAKVAGLLIIIGGAFLWHGTKTPSGLSTSGFSLGNFGTALIASLLAFDGWVQVSFVAGEIRKPKRNIPLALSLGTLTCIVLYLLANIAYLRVLDISEIGNSSYVGASVAERVFGEMGGRFVSIVVLLSIIAALNGCFLTSPRVYFAQAQDGLFFRKFAAVHPRYQTPAFAVVAQGIWALVLVLTGSYETLLDYAMIAMWLFYGLMVAAVMILRRTQPALERPYRMWGYPVTPVVFLLITAWFLMNMLVTRPIPSLAGLLLTASGVPVYFLWMRRRTRMASEPA